MKNLVLNHSLIPRLFAATLIASVSSVALAKSQQTHSRQIWSDFDGDGYEDVVDLGASKDLRLLRNGGDGSFLDVTTRVGPRRSARRDPRTVGRLRP